MLLWILSPFSLSTFPVRWLRVLRSMEGQTSGAKDIVAHSARFRVGITYLASAVGTFLVGR